MDVAKFKSLIDAYGVGVRAGAITPQSQDEAFIRSKFGLPEMSPQIVSAWADAGNVKQPITLATELADPTPEEGDNNE